MDWEVATMVVHTINNIFESIKLNQTTVEKLMLYQTAKELFELYVMMSKGTVPKVLKKYTEEIYLTHGEDNQEVCHFFQNLENEYLEMLKIAC